MSDEPQEAQEQLEPRELPPENPFVITNPGLVPLFLFVDGVMIKRIEPGTCFGYLCDMEDVVISKSEL